MDYEYNEKHLKFYYVFFVFAVISIFRTLNLTSQLSSILSAGYVTEVYDQYGVDFSNLYHFLIAYCVIDIIFTIVMLTGLAMRKTFGWILVLFGDVISVIISWVALAWASNLTSKLPEDVSAAFSSSNFATVLLSTIIAVPIFIYFYRRKPIFCQDKQWVKEQKEFMENTNNQFRYCFSCYEKIPSTATFCPNCGNKLTQE